MLCRLHSEQGSYALRSTVAATCPDACPSPEMTEFAVTLLEKSRCLTISCREMNEIGLAFVHNELFSERC